MGSPGFDKPNSLQFTEQLEKWNTVRQSLYSQNGWCSSNVNQISKWDVGDIVSPLGVPNVQDVHDTGTNLWKEAAQSTPNVPDPNAQLPDAANHCAISPELMNLPSYSHQPMNATTFTHCPPNYSFNNDIFQACDTKQPNTEIEHVPLHLQLETLQLEANFPANQISNIYQISNQYQVDCLPQRFS